MPVHKHKVAKELQAFEGEEHVVARGPLTKRDLTALRRYRDQQHLTLSHVQSESFEFISDWTDLRSLKLYVCKIGDWSQLTKFKKLDDLFINEINDRRTDLSFLSHLRSLKRLGIGYVPHWTSFPDMSRCTRLKRLHLFNCKRLEDLSAVLRIPNLESFHIVCTPQEPDDLRPIMAMPKMKFMTGAFGRKAKDELFHALLKEHGIVYGG